MFKNQLNRKLIASILIIPFLIVFCFVSIPLTSYAGGSEELSLYSQASAVIDVETGRVLYGKNELEKKANASTTKILTCIMILELCEFNETAYTSAYATGMPKVKLGASKKEEFNVIDLLYSLMLESHNDSAVILAEHAGLKLLQKEGQYLDVKEGECSTEQSIKLVAYFMERANAKAIEIGCENTTFITPNGLDAFTDNESIFHGTTCVDLAKIMAYCISKSPKKDDFLKITQTKAYSFSSDKRSYSCTNHNAFLSMSSNAISGKTGFTNKAGYCYVGATRINGREVVFSLLGCGWPPNKKWKWSDCANIYNFVKENFHEEEISIEPKLNEIHILNAASESKNPYDQVFVKPQIENYKDINNDTNKNISSNTIGIEDIKNIKKTCLLKNGERIECEINCPQFLNAPIDGGSSIGYITYYIVDEAGIKQILYLFPITIEKDIAQRDYKYCVNYIVNKFLM